jgi:hypothetical protein
MWWTAGVLFPVAAGIVSSTTAYTPTYAYTCSPTHTYMHACTTTGTLRTGRRSAKHSTARCLCNWLCPAVDVLLYSRHVRLCVSSPVNISKSVTGFYKTSCHRKALSTVAVVTWIWNEIEDLKWMKRAVVNTAVDVLCACERRLSWSWVMLLVASCLLLLEAQAVRLSFFSSHSYLYCCPLSLRVLSQCK